MLWAAGAWLAWLLLRDRVQAAFAALLTPVWLAGEWIEATAQASGGQELLAEGSWLLALTYFAARTPARDGPVRLDLTWIGALALIPLTFWVALAGQGGREPGLPPISTGLLLAGWILAYGAPLALGYLLRGRAGWTVLVAAAWVRLLGAALPEFGRLHEDSFTGRRIATYVLCAAGSALMAWWGILEARGERINLGVAAFGLTVVCFYFDSVMDKLGRSVSLMSLGLLLLLGGYALGRTRRRLLARLPEGVR